MEPQYGYLSIQVCASTIPPMLPSSSTPASAAAPYSRVKAFLKGELERGRWRPG